MEIKGRIIKQGKVEGIALVTSQAISFFGGVDQKTGIIVEKGHELEGKSIENKILVLPTGKGSTVGSYAIYELKKNGKAPAGIIMKEAETVIFTGAIISNIPCIDQIDISQIKTGDNIKIDGDFVKKR